jgi:hypothetical protein
MRQWSRRAGYLLVVLLWLIFVSLPVVAFFLATQGQVEIGGNNSNLRLFLIQDTDTQGLGLQWTRPFDNSNLESAECAQTSLRYFLWEGDASGQNVNYCQCVDSQSQDPLPVDACTPP